MVVYPQDIVQKLSADQVFEAIRQKCRSNYGSTFVDKLQPSHDSADIEKRLQQCREMVSVLTSGGNLPSREFQDLKPFLAKVKVKGTYLQGEDFQELKSLLQLLYDWTQYLKKHQQDYPQLVSLTYGFISDPSLVRAINEIIDERGTVRDNASAELAAIRALLRDKERAVRNVINKILRKAQQDHLTDEDSTVTIRDGRLVIPLRAEHKRRVQGFVHDESATGQTVFLEPTEALQLNNEVRELQYREKREIARILLVLSDLVRASIEDLEKGGMFIGLIDFIHAKALWTIHTESIVPAISRQPQIDWLNARHPLLWLAHTAAGKPTVPLTLKLSRQDHRILIISGPNAGGKSVALKTVGLLQYLFQCGLPVPVGEGSTFGIFRSIMLDIGDTQSLENDLSTYSSHLTAMKYFHERADRNTLFLIDEFGTGTEPQFGGAIAESILGQLNDSKAFGIVTTHYQNLKKFGEHNQGVINGAMKYDVGALEPLFQLDVGKPGSSFAFEIAKKIGLPDTVITDAQGMVGTSQVDYEKLLNDLERERNKYDKLNKKLGREEKEIVKIREDYESLKAMLEKERKQIIRDAKAEARRLLEESNSKIERTIREIQESKANKAKTQSARSELDTLKQKLARNREPSIATKKTDLKVGDHVLIKGQDTVGEIMNLKNKQAQVRFGQMISYLDLSKLEKTNRKHAETKKAKRLGGVNITEKMMHFNGEVDVRGMRAEEAMLKVEEYINEALLLGTDQVRIIHGKGHGILRDVIRNHLKGHTSIGSMADEQVEMGGAGITLVTFK